MAVLRHVKDLVRVLFSTTSGHWRCPQAYSHTSQFSIPHMTLIVVAMSKYCSIIYTLLLITSTKIDQSRGRADACVQDCTIEATREITSAVQTEPQAEGERRVRSPKNRASQKHKHCEEFRQESVN